MKKVLIPIANGSEDIETVTMIDILRRANAKLTVASIYDHKDIVAARGTNIVADRLLADCIDDEYDLIALPGGMPGAEHLRDYKPLILRLRKQNSYNKLYAAICASPAVVFEPHGLLAGKAATCFPGYELSNSSRINDPVVVDGNCITSQGPGTAIAFSLKLVEMLYGEELSTKIARDVLAD